MKQGDIVELKVDIEDLGIAGSRHSIFHTSGDYIFCIRSTGRRRWIEIDMRDENFHTMFKLLAKDAGIVNNAVTDIIKSFKVKNV